MRNINDYLESLDFQATLRARSKGCALFRIRPEAFSPEPDNHADSVKRNKSMYTLERKILEQLRQKISREVCTLDSSVGSSANDKPTGFSPYFLIKGCGESAGYEESKVLEEIGKELGVEIEYVGLFI